ncbi:MAG: hypothetical protein JXA11_03690 [Phycisphaerae bacterium]|nr:hypothetical protein [Phycisphaerae bacterium]
MEKPDALNIQLSSLLAWVVPAMLGVAIFGVLPTWLVSDFSGVFAEIVAVVLVLAVMIATGSFSVAAARAGASSAVTVFMGCSLLRMIFCPALIAAAWWMTGLSLKIMGVWMVIAYILCLTLEAVWIVKALRKEIGKPKAEN